jgi:calpain-7
MPSIPLNLTVFPGPTHNLGRHVATSGPYSDALPGVAVPETAITAGTYLLIPSTFRPGAQAHFKIIVYSTVGGVQLSRKQ